jgi:hypothetical protein
MMDATDEQFSKAAIAEDGMPVAAGCIQPMPRPALQSEQRGSLGAVGEGNRVIIVATPTGARLEWIAKS